MPFRLFTKVVSAHPDSPAVIHLPVLSTTACVSGSNTCPLEIAQGFHTMFGGHLQNSYGQTEQGCITIHHPDLTKASAPTLGWPLPTTVIKIVADSGEDRELGELFVRSPTKTAGLWTDKSIEPIYEDGWIPTSDLVRRHADGCLEALGRQKDLIKIAGYPVYPLEIKGELLRNSDIAKAVVFAIPDVAKGGIHHCHDRNAPRENAFIDNNKKLSGGQNCSL